jgi:hypothetical protein
MATYSCAGAAYGEHVKLGFAGSISEHSNNEQSSIEEIPAYTPA